MALFRSLEIKWLSYAPVKTMLLGTLPLIITLRLLSELSFGVNGQEASLASDDALSVLAFYLGAIGLVCAQYDIGTHEIKMVALLQSKIREAAVCNLASLGTIIVVASLLASFALMLSYGPSFSGASPVQSLLATSAAALVIFMLAYALALILGNGIGAAAILVLFPLLVDPFIYRIAPDVADMFFYRVVFHPLNGDMSGSYLLVMGAWLLIALGCAFAKLRQMVRA